MKNKREKLSWIKTKQVKYIGFIEYVYPDYFAVRLFKKNDNEHKICSKNDEENNYGCDDEFFVDIENKEIKKSQRHKIEEGKQVEIVSYNNGKEELTFKKDQYWTKDEIDEAKKRAEEILNFLNECQKENKMD